MSQMPPPQNPFADNPNPYASPQGSVPGGPQKPLPPGSVKNYLVESILLLICCAGVFAIPAIVYAAQVNSKLMRYRRIYVLDFLKLDFRAAFWLF